MTVFHKMHPNAKNYKKNLFRMRKYHGHVNTNIMCTQDEPGVTQSIKCEK